MLGESGNKYVSIVIFQKVYGLPIFIFIDDESNPTPYPTPIPL